MLSTDLTRVKEIDRAAFLLANSTATWCSSRCFDQLEASSQKHPTALSPATFLSAPKPKIRTGILWDVRSIAVHPDYRRHGYGKMLARPLSNVAIALSIYS